MTAMAKDDRPATDPPLVEEEPFRLDEIFAAEMKKAELEADRLRRTDQSSVAARSPSGPRQTRTVEAEGEEDPYRVADVGQFVVDQLPRSAQDDLQRYEAHIKYWLDASWIRSAVRKSRGLDPQWPHDPGTFFKPGGGGNVLAAGEGSD